ncbi:hypothetical protein AYI69_g1255 [Smittium culicis]|uniref:Retrotransposon gag domain-containing protein n=1 Tax=Smittium culicis TaxID=133412 RepID=A0A1R1YQW5_9FUNG|nr:hypothetical protein AYI69_g1255 [Smittium culicis]
METDSQINTNSSFIIIDLSNWIRKYELFGRKNSWSDQDMVDFLDLYLDGKALSWFERQEKKDLKWATLKDSFMQKFEGHEAELRAWKELQNTYQGDDEGVEDLAFRLDNLFKKLKITDETTKYRSFLTAIKPRHQKVILKSKSKTYQDCIKIAVEEESLEKLLNYEVKIKESNSIIQKNLTITENEEKDLINCPKSNWRKKYPEIKTADSESNEKNLGCIEVTYEEDNLLSLESEDYNSLENRLSECSTLNSAHNSNRDTERSNFSDNNDSKGENQLFAAEKRKTNSFEVGVKKKQQKNEEFLRIKDNSFNSFSANNISDKKMLDPINSKITPDNNNKPTSSLRKKILSLNSNNPSHSIKNNLSNLKADITFSQLIESSPEIRSDLIKLYKKIDPGQDLNLVENRSTTNCKAIVRIFNKNYVVVIDTGAACSVITNELLMELGVETNFPSDQTITSVDGRAHKTLGMISKLPISIAGYTFEADLLTLRIKN